MDDLSVPHDRFHISHGYPFCVALMKTSDKMYMLVLYVAQIRHLIYSKFL